MRIALVATLAAGTILASCGGDNASEGGSGKRQAGSWSNRITLARFEVEGATPQHREQLQKAFDRMSRQTICMTPEAVAKEDIAKNMENTAGGKNCTFSKNSRSGDTLEIAGECTNEDGGKVRLTAKGRNAATEQDITMTVEPFDAQGAAKGVMEMHVTSKRKGECTPGDITPPAA